MGEEEKENGLVNVCLVSRFVSPLLLLFSYLIRRVRMRAEGVLEGPAALAVNLVAVDVVLLLALTSGNCAHQEEQQQQQQNEELGGGGGEVDVVGGI